MSTPTATAPVPASFPPPEPLWPLSVEHYHQMIDAGILTEDDPVELLDGYLVKTMPKDPLHRHVTRMLNDCLMRLIALSYHTQMQDPITLATSEPEPDIAVIRGQSNQFPRRHPGVEDVALVVEVAESSLRRDRGSISRIYARANIPEYWIVNLIDRQIEVYREPDAAASDYRQQAVFGPSDEVIVILDGTTIGTLRLEQLLPNE